MKGPSPNPGTVPEARVSESDLPPEEVLKTNKVHEFGTHRETGVTFRPSYPCASVFSSVAEIVLGSAIAIGPIPGRQQISISAFWFRPGFGGRLDTLSELSILANTPCVPVSCRASTQTCTSPHVASCSYNRPGILSDSRTGLESVPICGIRRSSD